jgi:hypothetical protein
MIHPGKEYWHTLTTRCRLQACRGLVSISLAAPLRLFQITSWSAPPDLGTIRRPVSLSVNLDWRCSAATASPIFLSKLKILKPLRQCERLWKRIESEHKIHKDQSISAASSRLQNSDWRKWRTTTEKSTNQNHAYIWKVWVQSSVLQRRIVGRKSNVSNEHTVYLHCRNPMSLHLPNQFHMQRLVSL